MANYRFFGSTSGPASPLSYSGPYIAGLNWETSLPGQWFAGYWWWVCPSGQNTTPVKCALWGVTSGSAGTLVPGSVVTSGTLTAGQWNYIPLATPIPVSVGTQYVAAIGSSGSPNNFPDTQHVFGSGDASSAGLTVGPLFAFGDATRGGTNGGYGVPQGPFTTSGSDPSVTFPNLGDLSDNLWVDVQVTDQAPANYSGTYRLWPNKPGASPTTGLDNAQNFTLATEIRFSQPVTVSWLWFWSGAGAHSLPTWAGIYPAAGTPGVTGPLAANASPSWLTASGSAASAGGGWVKCAVTAVLPAGAYKATVYNSAGTGGPWSSREYGYWLTGAGSAGISGFGPISAPANGSAGNAYVYTGNGATTPPFANGIIEPANGTFATDNSLASGTVQYPYNAADYTKDAGTPAGAIAECFWVDLEVSPVPVSPFTQPAPVRGRSGARKGGCGGITSGAPRQPRPSPFRQPPPAKGLQAARTGSAHGSPGAPRQPFPSPFRQPAPVRGCPSARKGTAGGITTGSPRLPRPSPFRQPPPVKGLQAARSGRWAGPTGGAPRTPPVPSPFRQPGPVRGAMSATRGRQQGSPGAPVFALRPILVTLGRSRLPWSLGHARNR